MFLFGCRSAPGAQDANDWWHPTTGLSWQWQLTGKLNLDLQTDVIDIDLGVGQSVNLL